MLSFLKTILKKEKYSFYMIILIFTIFSVFEFVVWNINSCLNNMEILFIEKVIVNFLTVIMMMTLLLTILSINNLFIDIRKKEYSLILLSGRNIKNILGYIVVQYGGILVISIILSVPIGWILLRLISYHMYIHFHLVLQYSIIQPFVLFMLMNGVKFIYIILINTGYFIRLETKIIQLMSSKTPRIQTLYVNSLRSNNEIKISWFNKHLKLFKGIGSLAAVIIICLSSQGMLNAEDLMDKCVNFFVIILGLIILINITIPYLSEIFHKTIFLKSTVLMIGYSHTVYLVRSMDFIINISGVLIPLIVSTCAFYSFMALVKMYSIICMTILLIMLFICLIFRFSLLINQKRQEVKYLRILGVNNKQLRKIKLLEKNIFYMISVVIPMIFSFLLIYSGIQDNIIEIEFAWLIIIEYLICALITYFVIGFQYNRIYEVKKNG